MKRSLVLVILAVACLCDAQEECGPVEVPWGAPCNMAAVDCKALVRPLFMAGAEEATDMRLVVDYKDGSQDVREAEVPWAGVSSPLEFVADDIPKPLSRIRWYSKDTNQADYHQLPLFDCWCEPATGEIERCVLGKRVNTSAGPTLIRWPSGRRVPAGG